MNRHPLVRGLTVASGVVGAATYSAFLLAPLGHSRLSAAWSFPSELEAAGQPYSTWYRLADAVSGLLIIATIVGLHHLREITRPALAGAVALAAAGVASVTDSVTSMSCAPSLSASCRAKDESVTGLFGQALQAHTLSGLAGFLGAAGGMILIGVVVRQRATGWGTASVAVGLTLAGVGLIDLALLVLTGPFGLAERARAILVSVWFLGAAAFAVRPHRTFPRTRRAFPRGLFLQLRRQYGLDRIGPVGAESPTAPTMTRPREAGADRPPASRTDPDRVG